VRSSAETTSKLSSSQVTTLCFATHQSLPNPPNSVDQWYSRVPIIDHLHLELTKRRKGQDANLALSLSFFLAPTRTFAQQTLMFREIPI
jgi:hypothetical protein